MQWVGDHHSLEPTYPHPRSVDVHLLYASLAICLLVFLHLHTLKRPQGHTLHARRQHNRTAKLLPHRQ